MLKGSYFKHNLDDLSFKATKDVANHVYYAGQQNRCQITQAKAACWKAADRLM